MQPVRQTKEKADRYFTRRLTSKQQDWLADRRTDEQLQEDKVPVTMTYIQPA